MKKIGLLVLAFIIVLGSIGIGYAKWSDNVTIAGSITSGNLDWAFVNNSFSQKDAGPDWNCFWFLEDGIRDLAPEGKNVASTNISYSSVTNPDTMYVTVNNAYPYYYNHIGFSIKALGSVPLKIWKVEFYKDAEATPIKTLYNDYGTDPTDPDYPFIYLDFNNNGVPDLELWWGDNFGVQMHKNNMKDFSFEFLVLEDASQTSQLTFKMKCYAVQWNEYQEGPIP